jgi:hypothetical protein
MEGNYGFRNFPQLLSLSLALISEVLWVIIWYISRESNKSRDSIPVLGVSVDEVFTGVRTRPRYANKGYEMIL